MNTKILLVSLIALTGAALFFMSQASSTSTNSMSQLQVSQFANFRNQFSKTYKTPEDLEYRFGVYLSNMNLIDSHNADQSSSYTLEVNQFADLTFEEFTAFYLGSSEGLEAAKCEKTGDVNVHIGPDVKDIDWSKTEGVVHAVKNQASCGSCWAFASTAALESALAIFKGQKNLDLSEQELVDCSGKYGNNGCGGGLMHFAYDYILDHGINASKDYPYTAKNGKCKPIGGKGQTHLKGCKAVKKGVENIVTAAQVQPVAVAFYVQDDFRFYKKGVYDPKGCTSQPNHAVTVVGFKLDADKPYFKIKNSWGTAWGDAGYFLIAVGKKNGTCSLGSHAWNYYPTV